MIAIPRASGYCAVITDYLEDSLHKNSSRDSSSSLLWTSPSFFPVRVCPCTFVRRGVQQAKLADPRPLIYVCDLHGYVTELAEYLFKNSLLKYIEVYVSRVNAANAPVVLGALIDQDAAEDFIKNLLQTVRGGCSAQQLVEEFEKRNRLRLLLQWLEARVAEGNQDPAVHNALAKIYIDTNR